MLLLILIRISYCQDAYYIFTIHFATINTRGEIKWQIQNYWFTIHFATINTVHVRRLFSAKIYLQYTLLLLIPNRLIFLKSIYLNLQYTLLLLIQIHLSYLMQRYIDLQYTLLLLILRVWFLLTIWLSRFTIHFATINTTTKSSQCLYCPHLQYTLLLLILDKNITVVENKINLQYTLLLLIPRLHLLHLHFWMHLQYTLLLLIRNCCIISDSCTNIYNTLCYY